MGWSFRVHMCAYKPMHSPAVSIYLSLFVSLSLCFALGLGGWAVPIPRSVERPHPVSFVEWRFVEWRVPPLQSETRTAHQYDASQELHTSTITTCVSGPPWHSHFVWACALKRLVLLLNPPYLPEPCLYPERKPYPCALAALTCRSTLNLPILLCPPWGWSLTSGCSHQLSSRREGGARKGTT